jgi:hypothetical protein
MKTLHVVILAGSILGAAWMLKPAPVEQLSQVELQRREELERWIQRKSGELNAKRCAASIGKTLETLDRNDPQQEAAYRNCMWPEESHGRLRRMWDSILAAFR